MPTYRSGFNRRWVNELGGVNQRVVEEYFEKIADTPLRSCDAKVRCTKPASYLVNFHGCCEMCMCDYHLERWLWMVKRSISMPNNAGAHCGDCRKIYQSIEDFMKWRPV